MSNKVPKIDILYEDKDCVVINKPAGLMVHPDGRDEGPFLTDWVLKKFPKTAKVGEPTRALDGTPILRPGIVHRLDRETSGALLVAKTAKGHAYLKGKFKDRTIIKKYIAFVWGNMNEEFGTITRPIGRNNSDFRKWSAQRGARGEMRDAETYWTLIKNGKFALDSREEDKMVNEKEEKFAVLEVEPKTGRTHQIRVHMLAINHPVLGDILYAPKRPMALGFERTALHARSIEFHTLSGEKVNIEAPFPSDFVKAYKKLGIKLN